jgi:uncharacterized membrane protein YfcA
MRLPRATNLLAVVLLYFAGSVLWRLFNGSPWDPVDPKYLHVPPAPAAWVFFMTHILDAATRLTAAYAFFRRRRWAPAAYLCVVASTGFGAFFLVYATGALLTAVGLGMLLLFALVLYLGWRIAKPLAQERADAL